MDPISIITSNNYRPQGLCMCSLCLECSYPISSWLASSVPLGLYSNIAFSMKLSLIQIFNILQTLNVLSAHCFIVFLSTEHFLRYRCFTDWTCWLSCPSQGDREQRFLFARDINVFQGSEIVPVIRMSSVGEKVVVKNLALTGMTKAQIQTQQLTSFWPGQIFT